MHIHLAVILYIVIFPLAVPKILLDSFWPKIRGKRPILAILGENRLGVTADGNYFYFRILLKYLNLFHYDLMTMCAPCMARCLILFLHFPPEFAWKSPNLGFPPVEGGISPVGERRGNI